MIKVACVGDSITQGGGTSPDPAFTNAYPAMLGRMLGENYRVSNKGVGGTTLLKKGDFPYVTTSAFEEARALLPEVVVVMLGTNDTKPQNWRFKADFVEDYKELLAVFLGLASRPRVLICRPCFVAGEGNFGINQPAMEEQLPLIDRVARETSLPVVDVHAATHARVELFPDRVHPDNAGAEVIARTVYRGITGREYAGASVIL